jgi:hypothetical protein
MTYQEARAMLAEAQADTEAQIAAAIAGNAQALTAPIGEQLARAAQLAQGVDGTWTPAERHAFGLQVRAWARRLTLLDTLARAQLGWLALAAGGAPPRGAGVDFRL